VKITVLGLSIWRNGEVLGPHEPQVSVWDRGLLYGDGVFEGLRLRRGWLYRPAAHLARLRRSARIMDLQIPYDDAELLAGVAAVATANRLDCAHVRIVLTRGVGAPGLDPRRALEPSTFILASEMPTLADRGPLRLITSAFVRKAPRSAPAAAKTLNYLDSILAKQQANAAGVDDALMLDDAGHLAEATAMNVFAVRDGVLETPPCTAALPGITRATVLELASERMPAREQVLTLGDLYAADEVFVTGTASGIAPVGSIDGRSIGDGTSPVTDALANAYRGTWHGPPHAQALLGIPATDGSAS